MKTHKSISFFIYLVFTFFVSCSSKKEEIPVLADYTKINIRWIKNYPNETKTEMLTGLYWGLSQLGAKLPVTDSSSLVQWKSDELFELNLNFTGFGIMAMNALSQLNEILISSEEYKEAGGIDLGRYISLTINSSNHYYKISNTPKNLTEFRKLYSFNYKAAHVDNSAIADGDRKIEINEASSYDEIAYLASEGFGEISDGNFEIDEYETLEVMENGEMRYGLYDINGVLKPAANDIITHAGKPSKCMWCHESGIQPFFKENPLYEDVMSKEEFLSLRNDYTLLINEQRNTTQGLIKYKNKQDHALMELIYISFYEPSARRLAIEWSMDESDVKALLKNENTFINAEFTFLGEKLYDRNDIDKYSPYKTVQVPTDMREESAYEPDLIR